MDQIEEIRSKVDIVQLISEYVALKKAGRNWRALCPFHSEKTPSFMVSPELGIFKCFGCGRGGSVFQFLMEFEKMDFGEALRFLAKRAGVKLTSYRPSSDEAEKEKLYQINHLAAEFYHYLLLNHRVGQSALQYILGRGISRQSLATFKLGYAPEAGNGLLRFLAEKKNYSLEDLEKAGLIMRRTEDRGQKTDYYDRFRNRLMFPLADHRGNVCGFSGRSLPGAPGDAPKYINTPETLIYHKSDLLYGLSVTKEAIRKEDTAVIVEGELDTISSFQAGVQNVVAIKGSALTESQAGLLKRFGENLVLALDMDIAGDAAARRGIEIADSAGFNIKIAILGEYKDPDEAAQKDPEFFKKRIKGAVGVFDFLIDSAFRRFGGETAEEKKKIGQELGPILAKISDEIMKAHYVKELAKRLAVEEEAVWEKVKQLRVAGYELRVTSPVAQAKINKSRREILEDYLLAILFQVGGKILKEGTEKAEPFIKIPANKRILEILADYFRQKKEFELVEFAKILPAELGEIFSQFCLTDLRGLPQAEKEREREIERTINKLERLSLQERLEEISEEMGKLEKAPAFAEATAGKEIEKLEREFKELSEQLK